MQKRTVLARSTLSYQRAVLANKACEAALESPGASQPSRGVTLLRLWRVALH
jgi:hypothetical protein